MVNVERFSLELYEGFLAEHPDLQDDDSVLAEFVQVMADMCAAAIAKYERESSR